MRSSPRELTVHPLSDAGIALERPIPGYATLGAIGFEGRSDYAAIGRVTNLAARLCAQAPRGHILISERVYRKIEDRVETELFGELPLKGFREPIVARNVLRLAVA
jgi:class 3 adenylate cyclase